MTQILLTLVVVLGLPVKNKDLIAYVKMIVLKMTGNANFLDPTPTIAAVSAALAAFESAETSMKTSRGVKGDRATKRRALVGLLKHLRDYVQGICELNVDHAAAIADSAGMKLRTFTAHVKAAFSVVQGSVSGSVVCDVKAPGIPATYYWSFSVNEKDWISAPDSMTAKITIAGLTPGQTYYFRYRTLTRKGMSDLSQIVSFLVK
jgi:hypothetical protein